MSPAARKQTPLRHKSGRATGGHLSQRRNRRGVDEADDDDGDGDDDSRMWGPVSQNYECSKEF